MALEVLGLSIAAVFGLSMYLFPEEWKAILKAIAAQLGKAKKIGPGGIVVQDNPPPPNPADRQAADEFFRVFDNPLLREQEDAIQKDLRTQKLDSPQDRERALLKTLASTQIVLHFERVHGSIWQSQYFLLRYLNERTTGAPNSEVVQFYDAAKAKYPLIYEAYTFERWLGYLQSYKLVSPLGDNLAVSVAGREFLQYLVATGKAEPNFG